MAVNFHNLLVGSISILVTFYANKYEDIDRGKVFPEYPVDYLIPQIKEYDFIIVGAGSAGGTLATKLAEKFSVLLIEAGGDPLPQNYVPANYAHTLFNPAIMHILKTVQQTNSALDYNGISTVGVGKFVGGSSVINGLSYNRGHPKDYDNWANITGDESWSYGNLLKYFKMTEDFHEEENLDGHLGIGGPLKLRKGGVEFPETYRAFIDAGKELGFKDFGNANAPQTEGFGPHSDTIHLGQRVSVFDAFIKPAMNRTTLTISRYSVVSKVDIDENNRAIGVDYTQHGFPRYAKAKREVIVSAGALNTPMILMRSGIGPEDKLKELGIPVKSNLPVGQNYQDHPYVPLCVTYDDKLKHPMANFSQKDVDQYLTTGRGKLSVTWGGVGQAFLVSSTAKANGHSDWPDIEFILMHNSTIYYPNAEDNYLCMLVLLGRGTSTGTITLDPNNIMNPGIWDPKWLDNEEDLKIMVEAHKIAAKVFESQAFKNLGVSIAQHPICKNTTEFGTDEYWRCFIRHSSRSCWHVVGTCKMGKKDDPTTVVDSELKVKGISGLRVIDNSVQPVITNANTNAPAILIGQKGAAMILEEYK